MMASDGSKDEFVVVHRFMIKELGLKGATLLVYARVYGFCEKSKRDFYESKPKTAEFLGISERTVFQSIKELVDRGLIREVGIHELGVGRSTKVYRIAQTSAVEVEDQTDERTHAMRETENPATDDAHGAKRNAPEGPAPENPSGGLGRHEEISCGGATPHEENACGAAAPPEDSSCQPLRDVHPIRKSENREFIGEDL
ncbi:hypothetical protein [Curtanaerobium respiraculi]|uniref:hypothetical protein n=1 Tax=Curtanaerobium respiraculi TaxID=2949669 RepID=UPI0024B3AF19|nr:hypothetical protein [Curtanaerobium respiraculi]